MALTDFDTVNERSFAGSEMDPVDAANQNAAALMRYGETASLAPDRLPAKASRALFDERVAAATVVCMHKRSFHLGRVGRHCIDHCAMPRHIA